MAKVQLRDLRRAIRGSGRSVLQSVMIPEVEHALKRWIKQVGKGTGVLIGGLAYSYYAQPRHTEDVDFLFLSPNDYPDAVEGFKKHRTSAFEEKKTGVEIELSSAASFAGKVPQTLVEKVFETAIEDSGLKLASFEGMIALKLCAGRMKDYGDVTELLKVRQPNMAGWPINREQQEQLNRLIRIAKSEQE